MLFKHYLFTSKKALVIIFLILFTITFPVFGDENTEKDAWEKFSLGLELLIDEKTDEAMLLMESVISDYPDTAASEKAEEYVEKYSTRLDRSGIVSVSGFGGLLIGMFANISFAPLVSQTGTGFIMNMRL